MERYVLTTNVDAKHPAWEMLEGRFSQEAFEALHQDTGISPVVSKVTFVLTVVIEWDKAAEK